MKFKEQANYRGFPRVGLYLSIQSKKFIFSVLAVKFSICLRAPNYTPQKWLKMPQTLSIQEQLQVLR